MSNFDPRGKIEICLSIFDDADAKERPVFVYRRLSAREFDALEDRWNEFKNLEGKEFRGKAIESAAEGLIDWRNQVNAETGEAVTFDAAKISEVINHHEAMELVARRNSSVTVSAIDKKKSESQRSSGTDN